MDFLTTTILGFNPDVEKNKLLNQHRINDYSLNEEFIDIKTKYLFVNNYQSKIDYIKNYIESFIVNNHENNAIKATVINNASKFLDNLGPTIIDQIDTQGIYTTSYGTIVFDIEKVNNEIFSLEIGKNEFGYFIEKNGIDIKQVDSLKINEMSKILVTDLNTFFE